MRTSLLLLPAALAATQVYLFPSPPNAGSYAPTLSAAQANAVMSHHLGSDVSAHDAPEEEGMWAHLLNLWDSGEKRARVVILEGGDAQGECTRWHGDDDGRWILSCLSDTCGACIPSMLC